MAMDLIASPGYGKRYVRPRDARGMWDRVIQIRGANTSRALAGADSVRPYLLKSKAPFLTA
jgi:hypothetical protein